MKIHLTVRSKDEVDEEGTEGKKMGFLFQFGRNERKKKNNNISILNFRPFIISSPVFVPLRLVWRR